MAGNFVVEMGKKERGSESERDYVQVARTALVDVNRLEFEMSRSSSKADQEGQISLQCSSSTTSARGNLQ